MAKKGTVWPPPDSEHEVIKFANEIGGGSKISVGQWPPPEFEEQEQQNVQLFQTNFDRSKHQHVWPPVKPGEEPQDVVEQPGIFSVNNYRF